MEKRLVFEHPPIVESVVGIQFSPLPELTSAHFGRFWSQLDPNGTTWARTVDTSVIRDQFEVFNDPLWNRVGGSGFEFKFGNAPQVRCLIENAEADRMIQLQSTRLHLNWKKTATRKPQCSTLLSEFSDTFHQFKEYCAVNHIGNVIPNQWEITCVNSFSKGEYWETPEDWGKTLPGLFTTQFAVKGVELKMEQRRVDWSFEIVPKLGRLHVSASPGRWGDSANPTLLLELTCRGPVKNDTFDSVVAGLNLGHQVCLDAFLNMTNDALKKKWKEMYI